MSTTSILSFLPENPQLLKCLLPLLFFFLCCRFNLSVFKARNILPCTYLFLRLTYWWNANFEGGFITWRSNLVWWLQQYLHTRQRVWQQTIRWNPGPLRLLPHRCSGGSLVVPSNENKEHRTNAEVRFSFYMRWKERGHDSRVLKNPNLWKSQFGEEGSVHLHEYKFQKDAICFCHATQPRSKRAPSSVMSRLASLLRASRPYRVFSDQGVKSNPLNKYVAESILVTIHERAIHYWNKPSITGQANFKWQSMKGDSCSAFDNTNWFLTLNCQINHSRSSLPSFPLILNPNCWLLHLQGGYHVLRPDKQRQSLLCLRWPRHYPWEFRCWRLDLWHRDSGRTTLTLINECALLLLLVCRCIVFYHLCNFTTPIVQASHIALVEIRYASDKGARKDQVHPYLIMANYMHALPRLCKRQFRMLIFK